MRSDWDETTICDACGRDVHCDDACYPEEGPWEGATLCPDCYAEVMAELEEIENED